MSANYIKEEDFGLSIFGHVPLQNCHLELPKNGQIYTHDRPQPRKRTSRKKKPKIKQNNSLRKNIGHWSLDEKRKYHWFLEIHYNHFLNKHLRRSDKIFKAMQSFIGTRQAEQCRSHHQKIQKKYDSFQSILLNLRKDNYGTQDHRVVQEDLISNNIEAQGHLLRMEQLCQPKIKKQQNFGLKMEIMQLKQEDKSLQNMFSDRFQLNMDFNFIGQRYFPFKQQ